MGNFGSGESRARSRKPYSCMPRTSMSIVVSRISALNATDSTHARAASYDTNLFASKTHSSSSCSVCGSVAAADPAAIIKLRARSPAALRTVETEG